MSRKDRFHQAVKNALEKDGWTITHDPLSLKIGTFRLQVDLGAEKLIAAEERQPKNCGGNQKFSPSFKNH